MSYKQIDEGISRAKEIKQWESLLISYNHDARPNEYVCYKMNFASQELLSETINSICSTYLRIVNKFDNKVFEYTGTNPKNVVDKISVKNPLISQCWNSLLEHIINCDDSTEFKNIKANAYIFVGSYVSQGKNKNLYLLTKKNPLLTYKKRKIFTSLHNTIEKTEDPLVQFNKSADALIYNDVIYTINPNCESIFNMEQTHKIICQKCLSEIEKLNMIENIEDYTDFASRGQTPKKFVAYDATIVDLLKDHSFRKKLSNKLKIPINPESKQFDLSDEKHAKLFTNVICGKIKQEFFNNNIVEVPSFTPVNL